MLILYKNDRNVRFVLFTKISIGSMVTHGNGSGTDFGASQCIPMDLDAAGAVNARCGYTLIV